METACELDFADGHYRFWLPVGLAVRLERELSLTIAGMYARLIECTGINELGEYVFTGGGEAISVEAMRAVIRTALEGGNCGIVDGVEGEVGPLRAKDLVNGYVFPARPLGEGLALASHILVAALHGIELKKKSDDPLDKTTPTNNGSSKASSSPTVDS